MYATALPKASRRSGVTLIELMVVILIISILAALSYSVVSQAVRGQSDQNTTVILQKVSRAVNSQWTKVLQDAESEMREGKAIPTSGTMPPDPDQKMKLWKRLRLAQEFPTTWTEATVGPTLTFGSYTATLGPKKAYRDLLVNYGVPDPGGNQAQQDQLKAVLLVLALGQPRKGINSPLDEIIGGSANLKRIPLGSGEFEIIRDQWGTPFRYQRIKNDLDFQVESAGADKDFYAPNDNVASDRLRRFGQRGD